MSAHTPGPWSIGDENNSHAQVCIGATDMTADMSRESSYTGQMTMSREEMIANALLIAAAPELLEALEEAAQVIKDLHGDVAWDTYNDHSPEMKRIRAAIAKAKGEAK